MALRRSENIKPVPQFIMVEAYREVPWESSRICKHYGSERATEDYRETVKIHTLNSYFVFKGSNEYK